MINLMDMANFTFLVLVYSIRVVLKIIYFMGLENYFQIMEIITKGNFIMVMQMDLVKLNGLMEVIIKEILKKILLMVMDHIIIIMVAFIKENSKKEKEWGKVHFS